MKGEIKQLVGIFGMAVWAFIMLYSLINGVVLTQPWHTYVVLSLAFFGACSIYFALGRELNQLIDWMDTQYHKGKNVEMK